jgi:hypothetical protein
LRPSFARYLAGLTSLPRERECGKRSAEKPRTLGQLADRISSRAVTYNGVPQALVGCEGKYMYAEFLQSRQAILPPMALIRTEYGFISAMNIDHAELPQAEETLRRQAEMLRLSFDAIMLGFFDVVDVRIAADRRSRV